MVQTQNVPLSRSTAVGVTVALPRTTLIAVATEVGYVMCGALDVRLLDERLSSRGVVAARVLGVRSIEALLDAPVDDLTTEAATLGVRRGMTGRDALERMQAPSLSAGR